MGYSVGHMDLELTIDDPKMYTKPFITVKATKLLIPDSDVLEYACEENEKDCAYLGKQWAELALRVR